MLSDFRYRSAIVDKKSDTNCLNIGESNRQAVPYCKVIVSDAGEPLSDHDRTEVDSNESILSLELFKKANLKETDKINDIQSVTYKVALKSGSEAVSLRSSTSWISFRTVLHPVASSRALINIV